MREKYKLECASYADAELAIQYDHDGGEFTIRAASHSTSLVTAIAGVTSTSGKTKVLHKCGVHMRSYYKDVYKTSPAHFATAIETLRRKGWVLTKTRKLWRS